jgi:hypothetical protein
MADGDVEIKLSIRAGSTKTVTIDKATKDKGILYLQTLPMGGVAMSDAEWLVYQINQFASKLVGEANNRLKVEAAITPKTFTAAS